MNDNGNNLHPSTSGNKFEWPVLVCRMIFNWLDLNKHDITLLVTHQAITLRICEPYNDTYLHIYFRIERRF